jgi:hypothetical protein
MELIKELGNTQKGVFKGLIKDGTETLYKDELAPNS